VAPVLLAVVLLLTLLVASARAAAQDRSLSENFPLHLDDAFATTTGEAAARTSIPRRAAASWRRPRRRLSGARARRTTSTGRR
jgi:hypothetical protein